MKYSLELLEETPERVTKLLTGIGAVPTIRTLLAAAGMTDADIAEGRKLLLDCLATPGAASVDTDTESAKAQREAVAELDQWDGPNFDRFGATLRRHDEDVAAYVFHDLSASEGAAAVKGVALFLQRLAALDEGTDPSRSDKKKSDKKAVAILGQRGLTKAERARLQALVDTALGPTESLSEAALAETTPAEDERIARLTALRDWYDEWSAHARSVVTKKVYRIRLGLAKRKSPVRKAAKGTEPPK